MPDLSVLIAARQEMFLKNTIEDVLAHARGDTEIIIVLDGAWADPPLVDHPRVRLIYRPEAIGQRAAVNLAARLSTAHYVMKLDAHCSVDDGFDVKLIQADQEIGRPDVTQIPAQFNLHAFNWKCQGCGTETYQGPTPTVCAICAAKGTPGGPFDRVMYWDLNAGGVPGRPRRTEFWRFDANLHFQYAGPRRQEQRGSEIADVMTSIGACFFMRRDRFWEIGGLDENAGSWGQFGQEIACKSWLSGGRHVVNRRTWYAHLFRTQGGDFSFPYANPNSVVEKARAHAREIWFENKWSGQTLPLSWLLEHFAPIRGWHDPEPKETANERKAREAQLEFVREAGMRFNYASRNTRAHRSGETETGGTADVGRSGVFAGAAHFGAREAGQGTRSAGVSKGLAYYSDCRGDPRILSAVRQQLRRAAGDLPLVSVTLAPIRSLGPHELQIVINLERGYLTMFKQQLRALEELRTDVVFMVEHDVLYHPSHFEFTPLREDVFYFNQHTWRVDAETGRALFYRCNQVSGLCAYRELLVEHYRKRVACVEAHGFDRNLGFEPGSNRRVRALDPHGAETWMSPEPNVDIKTQFCLTKGRWSQEKFRNKNSCLGWTESDRIRGWGITLGRFDQFLAEVGQTASASEGVA